MHWDKFQTAWLSSEYGSGFIGEDAEWLNALLASGDGLSWYIGLESLSGLVFKVQGGDAGKVLWAYPTSIREPAEAIR
jgi:hypothetical protein